MIHTVGRVQAGVIPLLVFLISTVACGPSEDEVGAGSPDEDAVAAGLPGQEEGPDIGWRGSPEPVCDIQCGPDEIFREADCSCEEIPQPASCPIQQCPANHTLANADSEHCHCVQLPPIDPNDEMVILDPSSCVKIDTATGLAGLDENCTRTKGRFTLGLGFGPDAEPSGVGAVQQGLYAPVAEVHITGSGLNEDGTVCAPEPTPCAGGRGTYDTDTGILTATVNITNGTRKCVGCVEEPCECEVDEDCPLGPNDEPGVCAWVGRDMNCLAVQYLAEYMSAYGPECADNGYLALGNSNAPPTSMPSTRVDFCFGCDPTLTDCVCETDADCPPDDNGDPVLCVPSGQQTTNDNLFVLGSLGLGETYQGLEIRIQTNEDAYCPHMFAVVEEMAGDEAGFDCKTTCGDRIVSSNNDEVCEPFALGRCAGIRPLEVATQDCSRDFECVYAGTCSNAPDIVCVNSHQCPPDPSKLPFGVTLSQLMSQSIPYIPSEYRGDCNVTLDWGPCIIETDDPDIGCEMVGDQLNRKEICECEIIGWYNPENLPHSLPITDPSVPGVCVGEPIPQLVQMYMDAGCTDHATTTMENLRRKVFGLSELPMPTTMCCQVGDVNPGSFLPPETCCLRPACCGDANYPVGPKLDLTCPCGEPPLYQCP